MIKWTAQDRSALQTTILRAGVAEILIDIDLVQMYTLLICSVKKHNDQGEIQGSLCGR